MSSTMPSTPIDVCDLSRELESAARQDSKRGVKPTPSLGMNPWLTLTPGHLSACPMCQRSSSGKGPVNNALCAMFETLLSLHRFDGESSSSEHSPPRVH